MEVFKTQGKKSSQGHKLKSTEPSNETQKRRAEGSLDYMRKTMFIGRMKYSSSICRMRKNHLE